MRLIGKIKEEKEAYLFYSFLMEQKIDCNYETSLNPKTNHSEYLIWVVDEDDLDRARLFFNEFQRDPKAEKFVFIPKEPLPFVEEADGEIPDGKPVLPQIKREMKWKKNRIFPLTSFLVALCVFLYLWNSSEQSHLENTKGPIGENLATTPLEQLLYYDDPPQMQQLNQLVENYPLKAYQKVSELPQEAQQQIAQIVEQPSWSGVYSFLLYPKQGVDFSLSFIKIRQGQLWRLVTPVFLHANFLHIFFNLFWLWIFGKEIEERLTRWRMAALLFFLALISNFFQYLMSGPYFLGCSGVIVGCVAFIWMRQKKAPWEGYLMQRATALFFFLFVTGMVVIQILSFLLQRFDIYHLPFMIANTAHVTGGLAGLFLGQLTFFSRKPLSKRQP